MISLFAQLGVPASAAVGIAALNRPATIAARLVEIASSGRLASITTATIAATHIPLAFVLLLAPIDAKLAATLFTAIFFGANGVMSVARLSLPLTLRGPRRVWRADGHRPAAEPRLCRRTLPVRRGVLGFVGAALMALVLSLAVLIAVAGLTLTVRQAQGARD